MKAPCIIIGGGPSGLAAAIRLARYVPGVLVLEQHYSPGGLNSYYYRNGRLIETGLHAITNYASAADKTAPLNKIFRQLKIKRKEQQFLQQKESRIHFTNCGTIRFSNNSELLFQEIGKLFPAEKDNFQRFLNVIKEYDAFSASPFLSARKTMARYFNDKLLIEMLLCPLCYYGSSLHNDMDFSQFVIMFKSIFLEGMFRPEHTIREFIKIFTDQLKFFGGKIQYRSRVKKIFFKGHEVYAVKLDNGEVIECDYILSTIGVSETMALIGEKRTDTDTGRLGFFESIFFFEKEKDNFPDDVTIIFYNNGDQFSYQSPDVPVDFSSGVICFPENFYGREKQVFKELRITNLSNPSLWKDISQNRKDYLHQKNIFSVQARKSAEKIIGNFHANIVYHDSFTPVTIERYTSKIDGAIYGAPHKIKNGDLGFKNLFLAGTDQGFLGITGSMLSGISMVNRYLLPTL